MTKLPVLSLADLAIETLSTNTFDGLLLLEGLDISRNGLVSVMDGALSGLTSLKQLNMSGNPLKQFPKSVFKHVPTLNRLHSDDFKSVVLLTGCTKQTVFLKEMSSHPAMTT